jgi:hypothetical protein
MKKLILLFLFSFTLFAQETFETKSFHENTIVYLREKFKGYNLNEILVVHDIDNTLLAHDHPLGSDQWFRWQMGLLGTSDPNRVADDFEGLLQAYFVATNDDLATMRLTDKGIPKYLQLLSQNQIASLFLTARGPEQALGTFRELARNNLYSPNNPFKTVIKETDPKILDFKRLISFDKGIALINGEDKGKFLKYLIKKEKLNFKLIVLVDDQIKNINNLHLAFKNSGIITLGLRFGAEDNNVKLFHQNPKEKVIQDFENLKQRHCSAFFK